MNSPNLPRHKAPARIPHTPTNSGITSMTLTNGVSFTKSKASYSIRVARPPNCGDVLRDFSTTLLYENIINIQGNDLGQSNNEKDWKIRIQVPKCV